MKFHPIYAGRFAMGLRDLDEHAPGIIATQSTHKQLASFSQASQIHVKDNHIRGQRRRVEHRRFNESFLQHASTSPFYPLFASLDVGAQMMKGRSGEVLWDDTIRLGIELRKKLRAVQREFERKESDPARRWFFDPFVPDRGPPARYRKRERRARSGLGKRRHRCARKPRPLLGFLAGRSWHGFRHAVPGFAITDPNKLTLLTPGFNRPPANTRRTGFRRRSSPNTCARTASCRKRTICISLLFLLTPGRRSEQGRNAGQHAGRLQAGA